MKKLLLVSAVAASTLMASGYKIPEQSLNSTALAGAYVSNTSAADAAYYNPANMAFMGEGRSLEVNVMYAHLNPVEFSGDIYDPNDMGAGPQATKSESSSEDFIIPQIYLVGAPIGEDEDIRLGLSVNAPAGLAKRWPEGIESAYAEEFSLTVIEVNPSLSYRIMDNLAIAGGVRFIYSHGVVKANTENRPGLAQGALDMDGSSWDIGYNLALSYSPLDMWGMAMTYRSNVDLTMEGGAQTGLQEAMFDPTMPATLPGTVSLPLPAVLTLATDVDVTESTNIEFVYERTFWSAYEEMKIEVPLMSAVIQSDKNWEDTNTIRLGLTQGIGESVNLMVGLAYDQTPVPDSSLGFDLPDSDGYIGSIGLRWAVNEEIDIGAAILVDVKEERFVAAADNDKAIDGTFSGSGAVLASVGLGYKF